MVKNVVIINDFNYTQGGASKVAIQTANLLSKKEGIKVYFFSGCANGKSELNENVIDICTNQGEALKDKNKIKGCINGLYNFKAKKELKKLLLKLDNDNTIIHAHGWTKSLSSSVFDIAFKMNFKIVLTIHDYFTACPNGGYFNYPKNEICNLKPLSWKCIICNCDSRNYMFKTYRIIRQFIQNKIVKMNEKIENVITISEFSEKILKKTLGKQATIYRVYNPIDLDSNPERVDYTKNKYFLYVGRITKEKGVDIFCNAITNAKQKGVVVGDGSELPELKEKYPNIDFVGWKNSNEVKEYMKKAKALIIPSRWYEGAPLTPLEAIQYGVPVITSNCNASVDYIDKDNGKIFNIENNELEKILVNFPKVLNPKLPIKNDYATKIISTYNSIIKTEG